MKRLPLRLSQVAREISLAGFCALGAYSISDYILLNTQQNFQKTKNLRHTYEQRLTQLQNALQAQALRQQLLNGGSNTQATGFRQSLQQAPISIRVVPEQDNDSPAHLFHWRRNWQVHFSPLHEDELIAQIKWIEESPWLRLRACQIQRQTAPIPGLVASCLVTERRWPQ